MTGRARYIADLDVPEAWVGGALRSPVAHGRLLSIERDPSFDFTQVVVVTSEDIPGDNVIALIEDDQPILCADEVRHVGEPLALVAAPDRPTLAAALAALTPRIEEREPLFDMEESKHVFKEIRFARGDVDTAFAQPAPGQRVIEGVYSTATQEQMYIEPQGCIAWPADAAQGGEVVVRGSLQCPYYVQKALCRALAIEPEKARVIQAETGGGFGGKEEYPSVVACHAALLARKAGRPVAVIYDRHEDLCVTPKRHPSRVRHRTLVESDGTLVAMDVDVLLDGGAYATLSSVVLSRGTIHAAGPYRCPNVRVRGRVVATHHVPYGAFRGFGAPQTCFAYERHMDRVARELGLNPVRLREHNMLRPGDLTATGQTLEHSVGSEEVMRRALARAGYDGATWRAPKQGRVRRGVGLSFFYHGAGFTGSGEDYLKGTVEIELCADATVLVKAASTEIGQGTKTMFLAIACDSLGASSADVRIADPDTGEVPDSGPTVASRTCMIVGGCVARACHELTERMAQATGTDAEVPFAERAQSFLAGGPSDAERRVRTTYSSPQGLRWSDDTYLGDAYPVYGWACDIAEVEVDLDTFDVEVLRFVTAVDVGRAIQPRLVEGQIEGGTLQAVGFAHLENVTLQAGRFEQDRMATCVIPTTLDTPPFEVELVEVPFPHGPFGAKGVGELPMDGGAPAIASAIEDATGLVLDRAPATPEALLDAWLAQHGAEAAAGGNA